jgi:hypothetical protein
VGATVSNSGLLGQLSPCSPCRKASNTLGTKFLGGHWVNALPIEDRAKTSPRTAQMAATEANGFVDF